MAKTKKVEMKMTPALLKKAAIELQGIVSPTDDDGTPINLAEGKVKDIKAAVEAAAELLNEDDVLSVELQFVINELGVIIGGDDIEEVEDVPVEEEQEKDEKEWTAPELAKLSKTELAKVAKNTSLDPDDYDKKADMLADVLDAMGLSVKEDPEEEEQDEEKTEEQEEQEEESFKPKTNKPKSDKKINNKEIMYKAYKKDSKNKLTADDFFNLIEERVKKSTVSSWLKQWANGKNLPACAKKE